VGELLSEQHSYLNTVERNKNAEMRVSMIKTAVQKYKKKKKKIMAQI
jgi:hypothetical protein